MKTPTHKPNGKPRTVIVGAKIPIALLGAIEEEVLRTGYSRSDIIRRTLLDAFRHKLPMARSVSGS